VPANLAAPAKPGRASPNQIPIRSPRPTTPSFPRPCGRCSESLFCDKLVCSVAQLAVIRSRRSTSSPAGLKFTTKYTQDYDAVPAESKFNHSQSMSWSFQPLFTFYQFLLQTQIFVITSTLASVRAFVHLPNQLPIRHHHHAAPICFHSLGDQETDP
jgi:hypothetical protein